MMSTPSPARGQVLPDDDGAVQLVHHRDLSCHPAQAWSWLTEPERLVQWIGEVSGERARGRTVDFRATTDRVDPQATVHVERITVDDCAPPHHLSLDWVIPGKPLWRVEVDVAATHDGCVVRLRHRQVDVTRAAKISAGWHYVLDRLEAVIQQRALPTWPGYTEVLAQVYQS